MGKISGEGQGLKEKYRENGVQALSDRELLELFLFYAVSKNSAKEVCENLTAHFGSNLGSVFSAEINELCKVDGMSRNAAALVHLVNDVSNLCKRNRNAEIKYINDVETAKLYVKNAIGKLPYETALVVTLDGDNRVTGCSRVADGTVNTASIEYVNIVKCIVANSAKSIIFAHNHPDSSSCPSDGDIEYTKSLAESLRGLGIKLKNHLIVGKDGVLSMASGDYCSYCFKD